MLKNQAIKVEHEDVTNEAKELIKKQFAGSGIGNQMDDQLDTFAQNYLQGENGENYMKVFNQVQSSKVLEFIKAMRSRLRKKRYLWMILENCDFEPKSIILTVMKKSCNQ